MYYPGNLIPFQMVPNYHYNDFYIFNQNHIEVDYATKNTKLFHYDPSFYYADGYRTIRVDNNIMSSHHTINRSVKLKKQRSDWCSNCNNETLRRKNEITLANNPPNMSENYKYSNTLSKKDKAEIARTKTDTLNKNYRSKSINTMHDKANVSNQCNSNVDETCEIKERVSRIEKFENKTENKLEDSKESWNKIEKTKVSNVPISLPPPPPPPLPIDLNLLKSKPDLTWNRLNKGVNKLVANGEPKSANSFDAVVNELKFRLNKIKPAEDDENFVEKIPKLILTERHKPDESNRNVFQTKNGLNSLKEIDSGIQSTDTLIKKLEVNSDSSLSSSTTSQSSKQSSLNRLKSASKSNFGVIGIFKKNKEPTNTNTDASISRLSESMSKQSDNKTDLSSLSDFTDSIKCEPVNEQSNFTRSSTQNLNLKGKKVIFETGEDKETLEKNKKIQKRNTFSETKKSNLKDLGQKKTEEKPFINRLVKSKSDYINVNDSCLDRETQSSFDTFDLIKIESLGDLSNKQNFITAFSTRNFFQNDKPKEDNSKQESSVKFEREFKKNSQPVFNSNTLKSKSEIKINKNKQTSILRPIAKNIFSSCTLKPNQFKSIDENLTDLVQEASKNQIPSKYSSFVDLKKNKNQITQKNFNSLNRKNITDNYSDLINKASEYGIKIPDLLERLKQKYSILNNDLNRNENYEQVEFLSGMENFNQYSISDFDEQYNEFDQYLDLVSSF